jgi:hypothetical protein
MVNGFYYVSLLLLEVIIRILCGAGKCRMAGKLEKRSHRDAVDVFNDKKGIF